MIHDHCMPKVAMHRYKNGPKVIKIAPLGWAQSGEKHLKVVHGLEHLVVHCPA